MTGQNPGGQPPRTVHIGSVTGSAFAVGDHNTVTQHQNAGPADETQAELLRAVRELRADLARFTPSDTTEVLDAELVSVSDEIETAGAAEPGRLARLQRALDAAGALAGSLASGVAVAEALAALLGG
ncbi:hypothetical protein ACFV6M_32165 [Streptomyces californicus]|uniref:hypothetical protein n=1 Tax=Streptomyces TaxID=1883 RepID=UPI0004C1BABE|nr:MULTISPECIES: hypothetical protein [Streptomyces]MYW77484.1 hypothetical protein [Streptomyces sp. SID8369]QRV54928.1 hypothetical protein I6J40_12445 [Streptomyces californicus]SDB96933.1 hypothetical protein F610DRAFT_00778 [Streptomyces sp. LaPpAH-199]